MAMISATEAGMQRAGVEEFSIDPSVMADLRLARADGDFRGVFGIILSTSYYVQEYGIEAYTTVSEYYGKRETAIETMANNAQSNPEGVQPLDDTGRMVLIELPALMQEKGKPLKREDLLLISKVLKGEKLSKEEGLKFYSLLNEMKEHVVPPGTRMQDVNSQLERLKTGWDRLPMWFQELGRSFFGV